MNRHEAAMWAEGERQERDNKARQRAIDREKPECVDCNGTGVHTVYYNKCAKCYGTGLGEIKVESILTTAFAPYLKK